MLAGKKAILFDAGFTLLEPCLSISDVYYAAACALGVDVPRGEFDQCLQAAWPRARAEFRSGHADLSSSDDLEREAWRRFTREIARPFPQLTALHETWLSSLFAHFDAPPAWRLFPEVRETLEALRQRGIVLGVVSNWHSVLHGILAGHELTNLFAFVLTSAEVGHKKPHRKIFETALQAAGTDPAETIHVGDSWEEDIEGARALGITPVFLCASDQNEEIADEKIRRIRRLSELLA